MRALVGPSLTQATASCRISPDGGVRTGLCAVGPTKPVGIASRWHELHDAGCENPRSDSESWNDPGKKPLLFELGWHPEQSLITAAEASVEPWFMVIDSVSLCAVRLTIDVPEKVGSSAGTTMSFVALCALGAPVAPAQSVVLWQPLQSTPPVSTCVKFALGSAAN